MIRCLECGDEMQYDEGEGNIEDGYNCYNCLETLRLCLICDRDLPKGRNKTCSKKCARKYGYSMDSKKRRLLREDKNGKRKN